MLYSLLFFNVQEKLRSLGFPSSVSDEVVADIFGKYTGSLYREGLVDRTSEEAFDTMLLHLKKLWDEREAPFAPAIVVLGFTHSFRDTKLM